MASPRPVLVPRLVLSCAPVFLAVPGKGKLTSPQGSAQQAQPSQSRFVPPGLALEDLPMGLPTGPPGTEFPSGSPWAFSGLLGILTATAWGLVGPSSPLSVSN